MKSRNIDLGDNSLTNSELLRLNAIDYERAQRLVAEEEGFEPPEDFHPQRFSRPPHSTALPLLRRATAVTRDR